LIRIQTISKWIQKIKALNITKIMQGSMNATTLVQILYLKYFLKFFLNSQIQGVTNLPLLKGISSFRFRQIYEEVWIFCLQFVFPFPCSFFSCVVTPLNLAHLNGLVPRNSFRRIKDLYGLLLIHESSPVTK
jgi:hypothetical protein